MTSAPEILAEAARRGVALSVDGDRLTWRSPAGAMTPDLVEAMIQHKAALVAALSHPEVIARQRYGRPPDTNIPLSMLKPAVADRDHDLLVEFILRQPPDVARWVSAQAERYDAACPNWQPPAARELAAILDCVLWQWERSLPPPDTSSRYVRVQEAIKLLHRIEEVTADFSAVPGQMDKGELS